MHLVVKMFDVLKEQRLILEFLVKLGKSPRETNFLLIQVYRSEYLLHAQVFEWYKPFREG